MVALRGEGAEVDPIGGAKKRRFTVGRLVILLALGALAVWIGVRVRSATEAQVKAAQAQLRAAEAQLALADDGEKRTSALVTSGAQAPALGIQVSKQRELAAAQADAARAQVALAQAALSNHTLAAPFSGYV